MTPDCVTAYDHSSRVALVVACLSAASGCAALVVVAVSQIPELGLVRVAASFDQLFGALRSTACMPLTYSPQEDALIVGQAAEAGEDSAAPAFKNDP